MLLAERLAMTVAPAMLAKVLSGIGTHRSSQISTNTTKLSRSVARNRSEAPRGISRWPSRSTCSTVVCCAALKCRFLVELPVVRGVALGDHAQDATVAE